MPALPCLVTALPWGRSCTGSTWATILSLCHDFSFSVTKALRGMGHRRSQGSGSGEPAFIRRACCSWCRTSECTHVGIAAGGLDGTVCSAEGPSRSTGSSHPLVVCHCGLFAGSRTWGVTRVWFPMLSSLSKGARMLLLVPRTWWPHHSSDTSPPLERWSVGDIIPSLACHPQDLFWDLHW